jgi:hypothetical protein
MDRAQASFMEARAEKKRFEVMKMADKHRIKLVEFALIATFFVAPCFAQEPVCDSSGICYVTEDPGFYATNPEQSTSQSSQEIVLAQGSVVLKDISIDESLVNLGHYLFLNETKNLISVVPMQLRLSRPGYRKEATNLLTAFQWNHDFSVMNISEHF